MTIFKVHLLWKVIGEWTNLGIDLEQDEYLAFPPATIPNSLAVFEVQEMEVKSGAADLYK